MNLEVAPGKIIETNDARVSILVEDNASNSARVWLRADAARKFAEDILVAVLEITPDLEHSAIPREKCGKTECIAHDIWLLEDEDETP